MKENISDLWFSWFYKNWEKNAPGNLIEKGLTPVSYTHLTLPTNVAV